MDLRLIRRGVVAAGVALLVVVLLAACAPAATPTAAPTKPPTEAATKAPLPAATPTTQPPTSTSVPKPPEAVRVHLPGYDLLQMMFMAAKENGYYKEENLDVTFEVAPPAVGAKAMLGGEFQFSGAGASNVVAAIQGAPVKLVVNTVKGLLYWLYAPSGTSYAGLKGKAIGVSGLGSIAHVQTRALLAKHGLDPDKDVVFVSAASSSQVFAMLKGGSVVAATITIPATIEAEKAGFRSMAFIGDEITTSTVGIATTDKVIREKPEMARRFMRATLKGIRFMIAKKADALPLIQKYLEIDREGAEWAYGAPRWRESGMAEASQLAADIEEQRKLLDIKDPVPVEKVFDLSLIKAANQDLQTANWKP